MTSSKSSVLHYALIKGDKIQFGTIQSNCRSSSNNERRKSHVRNYSTPAIFFAILVQFTNPVQCTLNHCEKGNFGGGNPIVVGQYHLEQSSCFDARHVVNFEMTGQVTAKKLRNSRARAHCSINQLNLYSIWNWNWQLAWKWQKPLLNNFEINGAIINRTTRLDQFRAQQLHVLQWFVSCSVVKNLWSRN